MKIPEGLKCEMTPEMAYPNGVPDIPDGFEFVRFGPAKTGESYLARNGERIVALGDHELPYIIVRKKPQPHREMRGPGGYVHDELYDCEENGCVPVCEVKPITRQRVYELARRYDRLTMRFEEFIVTVLRELGIEVQD